MSFQNRFSIPQAIRLSNATGPQQRLEVLQELMMERFVAAQATATELTRAELQFQGQNTREAIWSGSEEIVTAIQGLCDYLGAGLSEVRWAVERNTSVSMKILEALLNSLAVNSRQYALQGIKAYDRDELEIAAERFSLALEADRTNYLAYQYLGFISARKGKPERAIRNFELAEKFAVDAHHQSLALSHLARCYYALEDLPKAVSFQERAANVSPKASFWYYLACYCFQADLPEKGRKALWVTIEKDIRYWAIAAANPDFGRHRSEIHNVLAEYKNREKRRAKRAIDEILRALNLVDQSGLNVQVAEYRAKTTKFSSNFAKKNLYLYREVIEQAPQVATAVIRTARKLIDAVLAQIQEQKRALQKRLDSLESSVSRFDPGCAAYLGIWLSWATVIFMVAPPLALMAAGIEFAAEEGLLVFGWGALLGAIIPTALTPAIINRMRYRNRVVKPRRNLERQMQSWEKENRPAEDRLRDLRQSFSVLEQELDSSG